jgi:hypothetical protein
MRKKILSVLMFIFLILGATKVEVLAVSETQIRQLTSSEQYELLVSNIDNTHEYYYKANNLNTKQKELYRTLINHYKAGIDNYKKAPEWQNKISTELSDKEMELAIVSFLYDYKVFFWLTGDLNYDIVKIPVEDSVTYTFHFAMLQMYQNETTFKKDLQEIVINQEKIKDLVDAQKNTYSKIKVIHDWLLENNEYNKSGDESHTPVGALVSDYDPVCEAYAEAFLMLANYVNIKTVYGTGRATNINGTEDHAWNYVWVYDRYYFLDVTWDKPINSSTINYEYFLTTIPSSHEKDIKEILPQPFTTSKYLDSAMAEFNVTSEYYYERTGSPIKGYEGDIDVVGAPLQEVKIEYHRKDGTKLNNIPKEIGVYYFVVTPKAPTTLNGDLVVYFEIVPKMNVVRFYDQLTNELIKEVRVYDGGDAQLPQSTVNGYKYVPSSDGYLNVTSNVDIFLRLEKITLTFINQKGKEVEVNLFENTTEEILAYNFDFINSDPKKIFIGWTNNDDLLTSETVLTIDTELHPLIEDIKFNIKGASKRSDGYYRVPKESYNKEDIILTSEHQKILEKTVTEVDGNGNYTIKLKVGSLYSTQERIVEIPMKQSSMLPFDLELNQVIFYGVVALVVIIFISVVGSVIKSRRQD